jgi:tetratricopeptide (TPR) repeat protein
VDYAVHLAGMYCDLGKLIGDRGQLQASLEWYGNAIAILEPILAKNRQLAKARENLGNSYFNRALTLAQLQRYAESLKDWDRAIELHDDPKRLAILSLRALALAHVGDHVQATREADEVAAAKEASGPVLQDTACAFSVASATVKDDDKLKERYATRAMELLQQAIQKGYQDLAHMKKDTDLDPLRQREDFQKLIRELEARKPAGKKPEAK